MLLRALETDSTQEVFPSMAKSSLRDLNGVATCENVTKMDNCYYLLLSICGIHTEQIHVMQQRSQSAILSECNSQGWPRAPQPWTVKKQQLFKQEYHMKNMTCCPTLHKVLLQDHYFGNRRASATPTGHFLPLPLIMHYVLYSVIHNVEPSTLSCRDSSFAKSLFNAIDPFSVHMLWFVLLCPPFFSFLLPFLLSRQQFLMIQLTQSDPSSLTRAPTVKKCVRAVEAQPPITNESLCWVTRPIPISPLEQTCVSSHGYTHTFIHYTMFFLKEH